ncbi:Pyridoxal phosphate-dependent enzyme beta subunit [Neofusicoccum parvum]|uniref:Pyridoxal phosphate-dependent enzyme beta subunit n=1 Tax=Neofusicoccum parvum TaxID=310453 RepID=A0ACB5SLA2_9PEZI|nr:Pyridoxal phosphate-dependent enzyme beta subunit [Neofusicoccum parvum]
MRQPPWPVESALDAIGNTPVVRLRHVVPSTGHASVDAFCGTVGTAGMAVGVARALRPRWPRLRVVVCEPALSPLLDRELCGEARAIEEEEGRAMCRRLAKEEALLVGTSTGLNVVAAIHLAKELGSGKTVVTVACDTGLKYLSGDLFADG